MQINKITIDHTKCILCGNCTKICGGKTLEIVEKSIVQTYPALCCSCGHCAAICPENAISSRKENNRAFTVRNFDGDLDAIEQLLIKKRSVREFKNQKIEKEVLEKLIYYAEKSPSSSNARKRSYIVITDENKILEIEKAVLGKFYSLKKLLNPVIINTVRFFNKRLGYDLSLVKEDISKLNREFSKGNFPIFRNAPCIMLVIAPKGAVQAKDDCIIAQQYMMLYAQSKGIGSCIIGYAQYAHKTLEKVLKIKEGHTIYSVSIFGYPKFTYSNEIQYLNKPVVNWIS